MTVTGGIAALSSLKSLYDLVEEIRRSNDPERLRAAASQMLDLVLSARAQTAALQEERNSAVIELTTLKAEIEQASRFDDEAKNYTRELTPTGAFVYREKGSSGAQGPSPYYCPHCFLNKRISILNPASLSTLDPVIAHRCRACDAVTQLPRLAAPAVRHGPKIADGTDFDPLG
jgi:hypothetical protein